MKVSLASRRALALSTVAQLVSTASSLATFAPGPSYSVGIPSSSTLSSTSTGPLYFQLSAPTTYQWVGFGIGTQMAGATIFVMYTDGNGNVTVSARDGNQGHVQPTQDAALQAGVTLLEGSGVMGGNMVANVRCTTCKLDSSSTTAASPFIAAWSMGSPYNSPSVTTNIQQHSPANNRQFTFDLSQAVLQSDSNPFIVAATNTSSPSGTASSSGASSTPASTGGATASKKPDPHDNYGRSHGVIMAATVVLLFPIGAIYMRVGGSAKIHSAIQIFAIACLIAGYGLGVQLAKNKQELFMPAGLGVTHTVLGTVLFGLFLIQPFIGLYHHLQFRKTASRNPLSHLHIWLGRILILLGIINGGLGLKLAKNASKGQLGAYGAVSGVVGVAYIILVILRRKGTPTRLSLLAGKNDSQEKSKNGSEEAVVGSSRS